MKNKTDTALALLAREDIRAFEELITRYERPLTFFIMRISDVVHSDAEDILQEALIKCWTHIKEYDSSFPFKSWLYRMTRNETISHYRKKKVQNHGHTVPSEVWEFDHLAEDLDLQQEVAAEMTGEHLHKVLGTLSKKYREVLILRYMEDLEYEAISDIIKKPIGTVGTLLSRAKKELQRQLTA